MYAHTLKEKLRNKELTIGTWLTFDFWPGYLEIYKAAGIDFVVLDMEHGAASLREGEDLCRLARLLELPMIIRAEGCIYERLRKYADLGPAGFMLPWVEREEQVRTVQDAIFCHPQGRRGPGGTSVMGVSNLYRSGWYEAEAGTCVMFQVETPAGIESMRRIMDHDWIDAILLGPYDLSLNLDHCFEMDHPVVTEAISKVIADATALGKPCGMPVGSLEDARRWHEQGCSMFVYGEPMSFASEMSRRFVQGLRG